MIDKLILWLASQPIHFAIIVLILILLILLVKNFDKFKFLFPKMKNRTCGDCIMICRNLIIKKEREICKKEYDIMQSRMNYVSQKLLELQSHILLQYAIEFKRHRKDGISDSDNETIQYRTFHGILKDALSLAKDEIRRAFKYNGFHDVPEHEFLIYLKNETEVIKSLISQYILNMYPNAGMIISLETVMDFRYNEDKIRDVISDIFINARQLFNESEMTIKKIDEQMETDLMELLGIKKK